MALASVCAARSIIRMRTIMTFILLCNIHFVATTKPLLLRRYESLEESPFFGMLSLSNWPRFQTIYYCMLFCLSKNTKWRLVYWKGQHIAAAAEFFPRNAYHVVLRGCMHWPRNLLALSSSERPQPLLPSKCSSSNKNSCTSDSVDWGSQLSLPSLTFLLWSREFS